MKKSPGTESGSESRREPVVGAGAGGDRRATAERQDSTVPTEWWTCHKCGYKVYLGLRHDCPTAPMVMTHSPYDLCKIGQKEYPGE